MQWPAYWSNCFFFGAYHHRFHSKHKKGTLRWEARRRAGNAKFGMEQRRWHQDKVQPVEHQSTSSRKCVHQEWSSTGKPSKPLAVDDPLLLPEREVHAEIGIDWFLDQEIPKGGYVRILVELLLLEERRGQTRIRTTEGLTTCLEPQRGWTIASSSWNFSRNRWLDREQELITVIQEETNCTEEKEEAGYRSPTWSILRALQKINKAKRLEGEAVMSASPFF